MRALRREGLTFLLLLAGWLLVSGPVRAGQGLQFLPPSGCIPADGGPPVTVHIYVWGAKKGSMSLEANPGSFGLVSDLGNGLFRSEYKPARLDSREEGTFSGTFRSAGRTIKGSHRVSLCPHPVGRVEVEAKPDRLLAGEGQQAFLHIRVSDSDGKPLSGTPLEITTNVGQVKNLKEIGGGKYEAVFLPPGDPFPQVANIMVANPESARLDRVGVARAVIPITARIELPGKTARGTRMEMNVAGRKFGPVSADPQGNFKIPILVPPGFGKGKATSIDRVGNRRSRKVNLFLPETNQLGLWAYPLELPADGVSMARLLVTTIDPFGAPTDIGGVKVKASAGRVGMIKRMSRGLYEAYYRAPTEVGPGRDRVRVRFPGGGQKSRAEVDIKLLPGPAAHIALEAPESLPADGHTRKEVVVRVEDAQGNPVEGKLVRIEASVVGLSQVSESEPGVHRAQVSAKPSPGSWKDEIRVEVREKKGNRPARIQVAPGSLRGSELTTALVDGVGRPVSDEPVQLEHAGKTLTGRTDAYGCVRFELGPGGEGKQAPLPLVLRYLKGRIERTVYLVTGASGPILLPYNLDAALVPSKPFEKRAVLQIHPPAPVEMTLEPVPPSRGPGPWLIRARLQAGGEAAHGKKVIFSASSGEFGKATETSPGLFEAELRPGKAGWGRIVVTATETVDHVGAVLVIQESGSGQ